MFPGEPCLQRAECHIEPKISRSGEPGVIHRGIAIMVLSDPAPEGDVDRSKLHFILGIGCVSHYILAGVPRITCAIDTAGDVTGQVNGLSIIETAGYYFGRPSRITARTYVGRGGVINIEREASMSGNIHSKGVLILAGYLGGKFAQKKPLGLTAQITFEQLYNGVEGDSASSAELYAILSSLSGLPLKQNLAVTGSVNQFGEIQPIGGVTEKIEGFFNVCKAKGLTNNQGVVIPVLNIDNLMLKDEVLDAVKEGRFHIYAVKDIEEGIELLTGVPAGRPEEDGTYPEGSVFDLVDRKLQQYSKGLSGAGAEHPEGREKSCPPCRN